MSYETNGGELAEYSVMGFGDLARQKMILDGSRVLCRDEIDLYVVVEWLS